MQGVIEISKFNPQEFLAKSTEDQIQYLKNFNQNPNASLTEVEIKTIISHVYRKSDVDDQLKAQFLSALMKISPALDNSIRDLSFHFSLAVELVDESDYGASRLYIDSNFYAWEKNLVNFLREKNFAIAKDSETSRYYILIKKKSKDHPDTLANPDHHRGYSLDETLASLPRILGEFCKNNKINPEFKLADTQAYLEAFYSYIPKIMNIHFLNEREDYADYLTTDNNTDLMLRRLHVSLDNFNLELQATNAALSLASRKVNAGSSGITQNPAAQEQTNQGKHVPHIVSTNPSVSIQNVYINPYKLRSRTFLVWLFTASYYTFFRGFIDGTRLKEAEKSFTVELDTPLGFSNYVKNLLLLVFGFDGYNPIEKKALATNGQYLPIDPTKVGWGILLLSIIGVPNRPGWINKSGRPILSANQVLFTNWVGGWTLTLNTKTWSLIQFLEIPFKFLLVLPFNLVRFPLKFAISIIKFLTELVPHAIASILMYISLQPIKFSTLLIISKHPWAKYLRKNYFLITLVLILISIIITIPIALVQYASVWAVRIGELLTSPAENASKAFAAGRSLKIDWFGPTVEGWIANFMGALGWVSSFALSTILWTLILPIIISAITTFFPAIIPAIAWFTHLPVITASIAWVSQFPVVTTALTNASGLFTTVGSSLGVAFGPAITPIAGLIGLQISTMAMTAGTTLGMLGIPAVIFGNYIAEGFSSLWIKLHSIPNLRGSKAPSSTTAPLLDAEKEFDVVFDTKQDVLLLDLQRRAKELAQKRENLFKGAHKSEVDASKAGKKALQTGEEIKGTGSTTGPEPGPATPAASTPLITNDQTIPLDFT